MMEGPKKDTLNTTMITSKLKPVLIVALMALAVCAAPAHAGSSFSITIGNEYGRVHYSERNHRDYRYNEYRYRHHRNHNRYGHIEYRYEPRVRPQVYRYNEPAAVCVGRSPYGHLYEYYC